MIALFLYWMHIGPGRGSHAGCNQSLFFQQLCFFPSSAFSVRVLALITDCQNFLMFPGTGSRMHIMPKAFSSLHILRDHGWGGVWPNDYRLHICGRPNCSVSQNSLSIHRLTCKILNIYRLMCQICNIYRLTCHILLFAHLSQFTRTFCDFRG